eukprot:1157079-Pelagomonas_calceolata.AAC.11
MMDLLWEGPGAASGEKELPTSTKSDEELAKYTVSAVRERGVGRKAAAENNVQTLPCAIHSHGFIAGRRALE